MGSILWLHPGGRCAHNCIMTGKGSGVRFFLERRVCSSQEEHSGCPMSSALWVSMKSLVHEQTRNPETNSQLCVHTQVTLVVKNLLANIGDLRDVSAIPGWGTSPGGGHSNPLQYPCLENPVDRGAWWATVHGVTKGRGRSVTTHTHTHTHVIGLCFRLPRMRHMVTKEIHTVWTSKGAVRVDLAWRSHVPVW